MTSFMLLCIAFQLAVMTSAISRIAKALEKR